LVQGGKWGERQVKVKLNGGHRCGYLRSCASTLSHHQKKEGGGDEKRRGLSTLGGRNSSSVAEGKSERGPMNRKERDTKPVTVSQSHQGGKKQKSAAKPSSRLRKRCLGKKRYQAGLKKKKRFCPGLQSWSSHKKGRGKQRWRNDGSISGDCPGRPKGGKKKLLNTNKRGEKGKKKGKKFGPMKG